MSTCSGTSTFQPRIVIHTSKNHVTVKVSKFGDQSKETRPHSFPFVSRGLSRVMHGVVKKLRINAEDEREHTTNS